MEKYKTEFKLRVVTSFLSGEGGAKLLAPRYSVPEEKICTWVSRYRLHGIDGLRPKRSAYSAEFKQQVLFHQDREQLSSRRVAAIYDIRNPNQVVIWRRSLTHGGSEGLENTMPTPERTPEPRRSTPLQTAFSESMDALREENERLRAEVAYLKKVHALQEMGLRALIRAKKRSRYVPGISDVHVPNVLKREFFAKAPNEKWATDITELNVNGQKLYLSACMDLYNGEIIAHRMARRHIFDLVSGTLDVALGRSKHIAGLTVHSDQGWHYKMQPYRTWG